MVDAIALRIQKLAPSDRVFFEGTIKFYVPKLLEDEWIILGVREWRTYNARKPTAKFLGVQSVIKLVEKLRIQGLSVRYSSCRKNGKTHDLSRKLATVGSPRKPKIGIDWHGAPNQASVNHHEQLGICVVNQVKESGKLKWKSSDAFRHVIVLALVRKIRV